MKNRTLSLALIVPALLAGPARADDGGSCGPPGSSQLLASMPVQSPSWPPTGPTYPEGTAVIGDRIATSGPANFGTAGNGSPSQLTVFDRHSGALLSQVPVVGEDLDQEHALSEMFRWRDYLYTSSTQLGVLRWKFVDGDNSPPQENYSTPFCSVTGPFPCHQDTDRCPADVRPGLPPLPNGIVVADDGEAFVADSLQGLIWRIPAASGKDLPVVPQVLFCSALLQGTGTQGLSLFGANGVALIGDQLYVSVTFGPVEALGPSSVIYRLPRQDPAGLTPVFTYHPVPVAPGVAAPPLADGLRVNPRSGHLFVALAGQDQISELDLSRDTATEVARYSRSGADHPFLNPSTLAFSPDGHTAYVSNHAITCCLPGDPDPSCTCTDAQDYFGVIELCLP